MAYYGYTWEAEKVHTDDGFILTTFHVTGSVEGGPFTPTQGPVLIQHGDSSDGSNWLAGYQYGVPMHLQLADAGYDVYIGSNRGTKYCQEHETLTVDQPEFWLWSWAEMGIYDDVANIKMIKEKSGADKIFYLGWSQGTVQMFYALAHLEEEFLADNLYKFVAMAPCTYVPKDGREKYWDDTLYSFPSVGVYDLYGPNWDTEYQTICDELSQEACDYASCGDCQTMSVQSESHWWQNAYTKRFQEYAPDYLDGKRHAKLIDIAGIDKVPIVMMSGTIDQTCPYATAQETAQIIGDAVEHFETFENEDHGFFGQANDETFMNLLIYFLQVPENGHSLHEQPLKFIE